MSQTRTIAIGLKIPDNEAFTALVTLQRLGVPVAKLERAVIWQFDDAGGDDFLERLARSESLFNPNKHLLRELSQGAPGPGEVWIEELGQRDDLRTYLGVKPISGISSGRRFIAWHLLADNDEPIEPAALREAISKLLCNPAIERALTA